MNSSCDRRVAFAPRAAAYRKRSAVVGCILLAGFGFWIFWVRDQQSNVGLIGFLICLALVVAGIVSGESLLRCPACEKKVDESDGPFCPECGCDGVPKPSFFSLGWSTCPACKKILRGAKRRRHYKIRYCRCCGAHVHEKGI